jgi:hypothetical protein
MEDQITMTNGKVTATQLPDGVSITSPGSTSEWAGFEIIINEDDEIFWPALQSLIDFAISHFADGDMVSQAETMMKALVSGDYDYEMKSSTLNELYQFYLNVFESYSYASIIMYLDMVIEFTSDPSSKKYHEIVAFNNVIHHVAPEFEDIDVQTKFAQSLVMALLSEKE